MTVINLHCLHKSHREWEGEKEYMELVCVQSCVYLYVHVYGWMWVTHCKWKVGNTERKLERRMTKLDMSCRCISTCRREISGENGFTVLYGHLGQLEFKFWGKQFPPTPALHFWNFYCTSWCGWKTKEFHFSLKIQRGYVLIFKPGPIHSGKKLWILAK